MEKKYQFRLTSQLVFGISIIIIGILFFLGNMNVIDSHKYLHFWPVVFIFAGIASLFQNSRGSGILWGVILIFIGSAMTLDEISIITFHLWDYWPLILIFAGLTMVMKSPIFLKAVKGSERGEKDTTNFIRTMAVMGGIKRTNNSRDFKGGDLTAIMGGIEIDLRDASIQNEAVIDLFAMMGGMEIRVPEDWFVIIDAFPLMGGFDDKTRPPKDSPKRLYIRGTVIMGGVEIKN
jgi:predicted membrane protein